jgi:hypothetical protein
MTFAYFWTVISQSLKELSTGLGGSESSVVKFALVSSHTATILQMLQKLYDQLWFNCWLFGVQ